MQISMGSGRYLLYVYNMPDNPPANAAKLLSRRNYMYLFVPSSVVFVWIFRAAADAAYKWTRNSPGDEIANVTFLYDDIVHALKMQ